MALTTELAQIHDDQVVMRATISFPDGTAVSAYAAEPADSAGLLDGALEVAEQRATARALDLLGVGEVPDPRREVRVDDGASDQTPPAVTMEPERPPVVRPDERNTPPVMEALRRGIQGRPRAETAPEMPPVEEAPAASPGRPPRMVITAPVDNRPAGAEDRPPVEPESSSPPQRPETIPVRRPARPEPPAGDPVDDDTDEPDMADYSWTHFWTWAREYELKTKGQVEQKIGRTIDGLGPQEVRQLLNEAGVPL